jgi:hypothetical protein
MPSNRVPTQQIPEVAAFEDVKQRFEQFKADNPQFFEYLQAIAEEYNDKLQAADKAVRAQKVSCGDFLLKTSQTRYYPEDLYNAVGREEFLELGGKLSTRTVYEVDKKRLDAAITAGRVPEDLIPDVRKVTPVFKKPEQVVLP